MIVIDSLGLAVAALLLGGGLAWASHRRRKGVPNAGFARRTDPVAAYRAVIQALDEMGEGLMIIENERYTFVNEALCRLSGYSREELLALESFAVVFHPDARLRILSNHRRRLTGEQLVTRYESLLAHRDGNPIPVEISISVLHLEQRVAAVVAVRDIRERKQHEQELLLHRDRLQELVTLRTAELALEKERALVTLQSVGDAVITTDQAGIVTYLSPAAEALTRWRSEEAVGRAFQTVVPIVDELTGAPGPNPVERCLREGRIRGLGCQSLLLSRDGREIAIELSAAPIRADTADTLGAVVVLHDMSEQRQLTQRLSHQATHDALTGLINRFEFEQRLQRLIDEARSSDQAHAICYLDLDQFKVVNDTCGHAAGDQLLKQLSNTLRQRMRKADTLARLGGDEFGILLEGCRLERAAAVAQSLLDVIREFQFAWADKRFHVGASIGVVPVSATTEDLSQVLRAADAACYAAKERGRNRVHIYQENDAELARRHGEMQWVTRLNDALAHDRFCLYYQPIVALQQDGGPGHYEVLLRLLDEHGRLVPPGAFIPAAERYNLMAQIDRWVIRKVIAWYARKMPRTAAARLSVNLSATSLNDASLADYITGLLDDFEVSPSALCLEITETATVANLAEATQLISDLRSAGCAFALDDFGIGMSSFAYLKSLPVDYLKIDGNFVKDIVSDAVDAAMVDAINRLAHVMNIPTIAEYVENEEIRARLKALGVDYGQGYGIAVPRPLDELVL